MKKPDLNNNITNISFDLSDINTHSQDFKSKFIELGCITKEDKISIWNNKIHKDKSWYGIQWVWRKGWGQGRDYIKIYLNTQFNDYMQLLDMIIQAEKQHQITDDTYPDILNIIKYNKDLIVNIIPGLNIINTMYIEDIELNLSSIIINIIDNLERFISIYNICKEKYENRNTTVGININNLSFYNRLPDTNYLLSSNNILHL